jgi:hypothetical protein
LGELLGITADGWIAIATFVSAIIVALGIVYGAHQFVRQQEARDVRHYLIEDGAWKLQASLDRLLRTIRLNYVIAGHLLRTVRDVPKSHPFAPKGEDLPRLLPLDPTALNFEAIGPTSRLLNCQELGALVTKAFGVLYNIHVDFIVQVEQSIRTYYSAQYVPPTADQKQLVSQLTDLIDAQYKHAEEFADLPRWIEDAALRAQELRVTRFGDISRIHNDDTIKRLANSVRDMWRRLEKSGDGSSVAGGFDHDPQEARPRP